MYYLTWIFKNQSQVRSVHTRCTNNSFVHTCCTNKTNFFYLDGGATRRKECTEEVQKQVFHQLLARSRHGVLPKNATKEIATNLDLHIRTVQRLWALLGKTSLDQGTQVTFGSRKRGRCGRKPTPINFELLRSVPLKDRTTLADASKVLHVSKKTLLMD